MKNQYKLLGILLLLLANFQSTQAQIIPVGGTVTINGATNSAVGNTDTYTITTSSGVTITSANWILNSSAATIISQSTTSITLQWLTTARAHSILYNVTASNYGVMQDTHDIWVLPSAVASPAIPNITNVTCSSAVLVANGNPPSGLSWYWQGTSQDGTSTSNPSTNNYTATTDGGAYYIRAYKASTDEWSASTSVMVNFVIPIWFPDPDGDGLGGGIGAIIQCSQPPPFNGINYVLNNDDQCPSAHGDGTANGCPPPVELSDENYIYTIIPQVPMTSLQQMGLNSDALKSVNYFDGLGRLKQSVAIRQSANDETDIITHTEYDDFGRQKKEYLPYESSNINGEISLNAKLDTENYYKTEYPLDINNSLPNPFSEIEFEASPLNRVKKQASPGYDWRLGGGHEIETDYDVNNNSEVKRYKVTSVLSNGVYIPTLVLNTSSANNNGNYQSGELTKSIIRDENHTIGNDRTTEEFKNFQGQVVLKRTYNAGQKHDTYYVYDNFGNLSYVLPPKSEANIDKPNTTELSELCYQYKYDGRNRLIEKKIPGKGKEYIIYDNLDRPVMTQDAKQAPNKEWLFTKYDKLGRIAYTGKYDHSSVLDGSAMQTYFDGQNNLHDDFYEPKVASGTGVQGSYYENNDFPKTNIEIYTVNYYDDYTFDRAGTPLPSAISYSYSDTNTQATITDRVHGMPTGTKVKILGTSNWITTVSYYDQRARPVYIYSKNDYLSTTDIVQSELDFAGKVTKTKSMHTNMSNLQATITTIDMFSYDHGARLLTQTQQINTDPIEVIVSNIYDELGQLKSKRVGGTTADANGLQIVDYGYNVRGWLKHINQDTQSDNDLFNFTLRYNDPTSGTALYNGNISQTSWNTANTDSSTKTYTYSYDALNRITSGIDNTSNYNLTSVSYDKNGNILNLQRKGNTNANATTFGVMDDLTYSYDSGNKLLKVADAASIDQFGFKDDAVNTTADTSNDYTYDINGNMLSDTNKGITAINYNHLNLPTQVTIGGQNIVYTYDATGVKQSKLVQGVTTQYAGGYIYEKTQLGSPVLQFFNHVEGYVKYENSIFNYVYQYKDHLGNVRLSYADSNNNGSIAQSEIIEESNYYPFGLKHKGYNNVTSPNGNSVAQKYGFTGKEHQDELGLGWIDITARNYDAAIGRWMNLDPLAEQMRRHSPYNYAFNNPIFFLDPDGMAPCPGGDCPPVVYEGEGVAVGENVVNQLDEVVVKASSTFATSRSFFTEGTEKGGRAYGAKGRAKAEGEYGRANIEVSIFEAGYESYAKNGEFSLGVDAHGVQVKTDLRLGTKENNRAVNGKGSMWTANAGISGGAHFGENGKIGLGVKASAGAAVFEGEVSSSVTIFGIKIELKVGATAVSAHAGGHANITGSKNGKFTSGAGFNVGLGAGFKFGIKVSGNGFSAKKKL